ncbi:hypothetical protein [Paenibacillus sp. MZ03-122A]|uniref:hypothetical protein n=1 Tax=Paenibacillus sp. MZ03-122A TaxID=2962033 RepID=UPI0020B6A508|nr:hypothetical protein [Paenibacillus sp. MZ03-122A]
MAHIEMWVNEIWQADMKQNGLQPLIKGVSDNEKNASDGFVIVDRDPYPNESSTPSKERQVHVLTEVYIPNIKMKSYELFRKLHDNYNWRRHQDDLPTTEEANEINNFLQFAITTEPMKIARIYAEKKGFLSNNSSNVEWIEKLKSMWFEQYKYDDTSTSAFEHVFIGEEGDSPGKLDGHHFWYHYYINDGPFEITALEDTIYFLKYVEVNRLEKSNKAEFITIQYNYTKKDNQGEERLLKLKGGFFVGLSAEGLLAIGTVAFLNGKEKILVEVNGEEFDLIVWRTQDEEKHPRTFFPKFRSAVPV